MGVHPTEIGHTVIIQCVKNVINEKTIKSYLKLGLWAVRMYNFISSEVPFCCSTSLIWNLIYFISIGLKKKKSITLVVSRIIFWS